MNKYSSFSRVHESRREFHDWLDKRKCEKKRKFKSAEAAIKCNKGQDPYYCHLCGEYHLKRKPETRTIQTIKRYETRRNLRTTNGNRFKCVGKQSKESKGAHA